MSNTRSQRKKFRPKSRMAGASQFLNDCVKAFH
jgi:hypothetical protein